MEYTTFGRTGRKVSRIGFGGATAGLKNYVRSFDPDKPEDREPIVAALERALDLGINYFDTAAAYGDGRSEKIFGEGLQKANPEDLFLATKVTVGDAAKTRASVERSLVNLRRDWFDLIQIHGTVYREEHIETIMGSGGMLAELEQIKTEGLVRQIGFTVEAQNKALYTLLESDRFEAIQVNYNLIFQHPYDPSWKSGSLYTAEERGLGIVAMRTVTSGTFQRWIQMVNPSNTFDYSPALVQFTLSNPLVDVALLGMRSPERVEQNVAICNDAAGRIDLAKLHTRYV